VSPTAKHCTTCVIVTTKIQLLFQQTVWLLPLHAYPFHANWKNAVVVNYFVGGVSAV